jgi:hypothetical protein
VSEVILERIFDEPTTPREVLAGLEVSGGCFDIHRVDWNASYLRLDGLRMVCHFSAPDLESTRIALRQLGQDTSQLWIASRHDAPGAGVAEIAAANVLVERSFADAVELQVVQDIEDAGSRCLEMRNVRFLRTYFSADRRRMLCLYAAPDAESVRQAQREAGMPFDEAWAFERCALESRARGSG